MARRLRAALLALLLTGAAQAQTAPAPVALRTIDGTTWTPGRGDDLVTEILFVARWCAPCEKELVALRRSYAEHRRDHFGVIVVGVSQRQSQDEFVAWVRRAGFDGAIVFDKDGSLEKAFRVSLLPWHVWVDRHGKTLDASDVAVSPEKLREWLHR